MNRAEMYEYIVSAFNFDKTEAFVCIKPFYCTLFHNSASWCGILHTCITTLVQPYYLKMKISMEEISLLSILHRTKIINLSVTHRTEDSKYRKIDKILKWKYMYRIKN
ncbi:hypothetical protein EMIT0180MI3_21173 [Priestia megaterium]